MTSVDKERVARLVTLQDVAHLAGVSAKTVSNVVNDWPYVSAETRQKVQAAIDELGYRPSSLARGLVTGQTKTIGVVLPDISNPFFGQAIRGCEDGFQEAGYSVFLCNTDESIDKERHYLDTLVGRGVDGLILWGTRTTSDGLQRLLSRGLPAVTVDASAADLGDNVTRIDVDNTGGAYAATQHLIERGRQAIAHLGGPAARPTAQRRRDGYRQALLDAGKPDDPCLVISGAPSIRGGYRSALTLLERQRPDALFCYNDLMAVGAMVACRQLNLSVPRDIAVVGFDDIVIAPLVSPPLTTVRINQYELGKLTSQLLLERLQGKAQGAKQVTFATELQVRNSCGARRLDRRQLSHLLEDLVSSVAVDLPSDYPLGCGEEAGEA